MLFHFLMEIIIYNAEDINRLFANLNRTHSITNINSHLCLDSTRSQPSSSVPSQKQLQQTSLRLNIEVGSNSQAVRSKMC